MSQPDKLTAGRRRFVQEYLLDPNTTQAAIKAGFSRRSAYSQGQRLLKNVEIKAALATVQDRLAQKAEITSNGCSAKSPSGR